MFADKGNSTIGDLFSRLFNMPNIQGRQYAPGWQPNSPGESSTPGWSGGRDFRAIPWPTAVPSLVALASHPGIPRTPAEQISNNAYAYLPVNNLFISGFIGKSQG